MSPLQMPPWTAMLGVVVFLFSLMVSAAAVAYRQPFDYIDAALDFGNSFLSPKNAEIAKLIVSPSLADDIIGRIDISTTFLGGELNTEYIWGLFANVAGMGSNLSLVGSPVSSILQELVVEPPIVSASMIVDFDYPSINFTLPVQIDFWLRFDRHLKISSYDVSFRRWAEAYTYLIPKILPVMAEETGIALNDKTNWTALVSQFAAQQICEVEVQYCTGANQQYDSKEACMQYITTDIPLGNPWEGGLNTVICRYLHKNMVSYRPQVHCPHIGPTGGDMCIARDYIDIVRNAPFTESLIAFNASYSAKDLGPLSEHTIKQLARLFTQTVVSTTVAFYPVAAMLYWFLLYASAQVVTILLLQFSKEYRRLSFENQRTTTMYVLNVFYTTVTLVLQLAAGETLAQLYTFKNVSELRVVGVLITGLYLFEMTYRPSIRWPLLTHHISTIFVVVVFFITLQMTIRPSLITTGNLWVFQATTEQPIFIGLFMYRLRFSKGATRNVLKLAGIQAFVFKFVFATYLFVWWGLKEARNHTQSMDIVFSVVLVVMLSLLMLTQGYGSWIVWKIAVTIDQRYSAAPTAETPPTAGRKSLQLEIPYYTDTVEQQAWDPRRLYDSSSGDVTQRSTLVMGDASVRTATSQPGEHGERYSQEP